MHIVFQDLETIVRRIDTYDTKLALQEKLKLATARHNTDYVEKIQKELHDSYNSYDGLEIIGEVENLVAHSQSRFQACLNSGDYTGAISYRSLLVFGVSKLQKFTNSSTVLFTFLC